MKNGAMKMPMTSLKILGATALLLASSYLFHADLATPEAAGAADRALPMGWVAHHIGHSVSFAYPANFVSVNDGGPDIVQVGGALMNKSQTAYELLLGVAIDTQPQASVRTVAMQLRQMYHADTLLADQQTPYGEELAFLMPHHMAYTVYLAPLPSGVREIIVNNEHANPAYSDTIDQFLHSIRR